MSERHPVRKDREPTPRQLLLDNLIIAANALKRAAQLAEGHPVYSGLFPALTDAKGIAHQALNQVVSDGPLPVNGAIEYDFPPP